MLLFCFVFSNEKKWTVGFMGQSICTIGHHHIRGQTHSFKSYYSGRWSTVLFHSYDSIGWMWPLLHINETCHPCKHKQITYCSSSCSMNIIHDFTSFLSCNSVRHLEFNQAWKLENPMIVTKGSKGGVCVFSLQKIAIKATSTSSFIDSKREMGTSWTVKLTINDSSFE